MKWRGGKKRSVVWHEGHFSLCCTSQRLNKEKKKKKKRIKDNQTQYTRDCCHTKIEHENKKKSS
jgi:hypothetical protein